MSTTTILVTGASGLLGRAVFSEFQQHTDYTVIGLAYSRCGPQLRRLDLTQEKEINDIFDEVKPHVIVHCAAERRPDVVEKDPLKTKMLNESGTEWLCKAAAKHGCWVLYISTDYVFDGTQPPYDESATPNPLNAYGLSKLEGEKITLRCNPENAVLRVPILYGPVEHLGESAVLCMYPKIANAEEAFKISDYERRYPTHVSDIAAACALLAQRKRKGESLSGVFHWSSDEQMTKYEMCLAMGKAVQRPVDHITGVKEPQPGAPRPVDARLARSRLLELGLTVHQPRFMDAVAPCLLPHMSHC